MENLFACILLLSQILDYFLVCFFFFSFSAVPPEKPTNLSCIVIQTQVTSFIQRCSWEPGRDTLLSTNYTLKHRW